MQSPAGTNARGRPRGSRDAQGDHRRGQQRERPARRAASDRGEDHPGPTLQVETVDLRAARITRVDPLPLPDVALAARARRVGFVDTDARKTTHVVAEKSREMSLRSCPVELLPRAVLAGGAGHGDGPDRVRPRVLDSGHHIFLVAATRRVIITPSRPGLLE